jgi:hypothetical protein
MHHHSLHQTHRHGSHHQGGNWEWAPSQGYEQGEWLLSAPWKIVGSIPHMIADLGSPRVHTGPCTLPLSWHKVCPLQALNGLHPDAPASFHNLWSFIPPPHDCDLLVQLLSLTCWFPAQHTLTLQPLSYSWSSPFQGYPKLLFFSPTGLLGSRVELVRFHFVPQGRSTLPLPSCFLHNLILWLADCSSCHLLSC